MGEYSEIIITATNRKDKIYISVHITVLLEIVAFYLISLTVQSGKNLTGSKIFIMTYSH